jgi:molybdenum cofactor biosynthesis enzyme MoaA
MAASSRCSENRSDINDESVSDDCDRNCQYCIILNSELQKVKEEVLSYKEIIKMLQVELGKTWD